MKKIIAIETWGGTAGGYKVELNLELTKDRELTQDEVYFAHTKVQEIMAHIDTNTIKTSVEFIKNTASEREQLLNCFGDHKIYAKEIPSEYGNLEPWFLVTTPKGVIKIGWRKRVINIDWSDSDIKFKTDAEAAIAIEIEDLHHTHGRDYVHAYGYAKATKYIQRLLNEE